MSTPSRRMGRGIGVPGNSYNFGRLTNSGGIKKQRSMLGRRKSMSGPINQTKLLAGLSNPESISIPSKNPLKTHLSLDELLNSKSSIATKYSSKSRLSFGSLTSTSSNLFTYKSKLRSNGSSFEPKSDIDNLDSLLASLKNSKSTYKARSTNTVSNPSTIDSVLSSIRQSQSSKKTTSNDNSLSSSKMIIMDSCLQLSNKSNSSISKSYPSPINSVIGGRKSLRKALFNSHLDNKSNKESKLEKSYLAIPLATSDKIEGTLDMEENLESIEETVPRKRTLSSIAETADDSTDSVREFLSNEAAVAVDAVVPEPSRNLPPTSPVLNTLYKINHDDELNDFNTLNDRSDALRNKIMDLKNTMDVKLNEYTVLKNKFDAALNEYMELENKKYDMYKKNQSQMKDKENIATNTPAPITCIKKSVKKFQDMSVKFNDSVVSQFSIPKTPVTLRKSKLPKRKSIAYTPKSLKKVLTDQVSDLCDS